MSDLSAQLNAGLAGRYVIERELGRGGMATVFLAEDLRHRRLVAIKVLNPEIAAGIGSERFLREIETAARLNHPHILPLHESGSAAGLLYYVMPYAQGESLRQRLEREAQLPLADALRIAREVADALGYAHRSAVVHRDIKPENILLEEQHAVVADFGIARAIAAAGGDKLTTTGVVIGTPTYMSPEQASGSQDLDARSDLYSLGCVLYEMLAGQPPFTGRIGESIIHQHLVAGPRPVSELRPAVPEPIVAAIARALAKAPADRFTTAEEFVGALEAARERVRPPARPAADEHGVAAGADPESRRHGLVAAAGGRPRTRRAVTIPILSGSAIALLAALVWMGPGWIGRFVHKRSQPLHKEWVMVADFEGPDSSLAVATRDLVSAALDASEIAMAVPRDQIRLALQSVDKPAATWITPEIARSIAMRGSVRTLLHGRIGRVGRALTLTLELDDVDRSQVLFRAMETAKSENDLIPAVGRLGRRLRKALGESPDAIRGDAAQPLAFAGTSSIEALKSWRQGRRFINEGYSRESIAAFREGLALDPEFAACWSGMGVAYANVHESDSAIVAYETALRHPRRLSEESRLFIGAALAELRADFATMLGLNQRLVELNPDHPGRHNNLGNVYLETGHMEEALAEYRRAIDLSRLGPNPAFLSNLSLALLSVGRTEEALSIGSQVPGRFRQTVPIFNAVFLEQWERADSLASAITGDATIPPDTRFEALVCQASVQCARGALTDARRLLTRARAITAGYELHTSEFLETLMDRCAGMPASPPGPPAVEDATLAGVRMLGIRCAAVGDSARARELWRIATRQPDPYGFEGATDLLEAWIGERRDPRRIVDLLAGTARTGIHEGRAQMGPVKEATRWLVAEAFERLGERDSAAACYERALDFYGNIEFQVPARALASSFAHQHLVVLYAGLGRTDDARRHWNAFSAAFTRPDPELRPLLAKARAALGSAEGMAGSATR